MKKGYLKRFVSYYKKYLIRFITVLFASLIMALLSVMYPIITRRVFQIYVKAEPVDTNSIIIAGIILIGIYIIRFALKLYVDYFGHSVGTDIQSDMRRDLFNKYEDLPMQYYDTHETGELMSRLTNDLQDISELAHHGPENILICSVTIIASLVYLLSINVILALVLLGMVPILFFITFLTRKKHLKAYGESKKYIGGINA
ncbi:MAG: ABC transporter ATP-binding protein, partial [Bacilli bacterium]|nr:ABC transporter ATP-binding protein [Bacilli bacterium]